MWKVQIARETKLSKMSEKKIRYTHDVMKMVGGGGPASLWTYHKCDGGVLKDGAPSVKTKTFMALAYDHSSPPSICCPHPACTESISSHLEVSS